MKKFNENIVETESFGLILKKDYENPRFSFLKRDIGVPALEIIENNKKVTVIAPEWFEWKDVCEKRTAANFANAQSIKSLPEEEGMAIDGIPF